VDRKVDNKVDRRVKRKVDYPSSEVQLLQFLFEPIRPKSKMLAQHGGPTDWLEESDSAGVILYVMDGP